MNIIEVMQLPIGSIVKCNCSNKSSEIANVENTKCIRFVGDFRRLFADEDLINAEFELDRD